MTLTLPSHARRFTLRLLICWGALCLAALVLVVYDSRREAYRYARESARESLQKDLVYRHWNAGHGGVYVPVTAAVRPNPYLAHLPQRDLTTVDGQTLTLINPAYMTRQVHELAQELYGSRGHITSLNPLRPQNAPDPWESEALRRFERGERDLAEVVIVDGAPFLRAMVPMQVEAACLRCHQAQGYRLGDIRGGLSVSVPLTGYLANARSDAAQDGLLLLGLWGSGTAIILFGGRQLTRRIHEEQAAREELGQSELRHRQLFEQMDSGFALHEIVYAAGKPVDYRFLAVNPAYESMTGLRGSEIVGQPASTVLPAEERAWFDRFTRIAAGGEPDHDYYYSARLGRYFGTRIFSPERGQFAVLISDITERMTAELKIRESRQRFQELVDNTNGIVWELDLKSFCFTFVSPRAISLLGYPLEDWYRPNFWHDHLHPDDREWATQYCMEQTQQGRNHEFEYRMLARDGQAVWLRDLVTVRSVQGTPVSLCGVMIDIDASKQVEQALIEATRAAQAANQAKTEFLANMSHELRTPLNGVLGTLQLLSLTELNGEQREYVDIATRSSWSLLDLLNDLLDLTRIEAGKLALKREPFDPAQLLRQVGDLFAVQAAEKRIALSRHLVAELPAALLGDATRIRQILFNLLGNAIKFTPEGGRVEIAVATRPRLDSGALPVVFTVADTGIGIAPEKLDAIFTPFVQGDDVFHKRYQGAGLGLAIVKRLVETMQGEIELVSHPGAGTSVTVMLPLQPLGSAPERPAVPPPTAEERSGSILLVEDHAINRLTFERLLTQRGRFRVATAEDGEVALRKLAEDDFDLVLMDIQLPVMDGLETFRRIRSGSAGVRNPEVPVVAMTAYVMESDREKFLQAGMDGYLAKPVEWQQLKDCLDRILPRT